MAKRTNRLAWGLSAVLALVVLVGGLALVADYQSRLPVRQRTVFLLPIHQWAFRHRRVYWVGLTARPVSDVYQCGFFEICRSSAGSPASTRNGAGR